MLRNADGLTGLPYCLIRGGQGANCQKFWIWQSENLDLPVGKFTNLSASQQYSQHSLIIYDRIPQEHQNFWRRHKPFNSDSLGWRAVFKWMFEITVFSNITLIGTIWIIFSAYTWRRRITSCHFLIFRGSNVQY